MSDASFEDALSSIMGNDALMSKISSIVGSHEGNREDALPEVIEAISSSLGSNKRNEEENRDTDTDRDKDKFQKSDFGFKKQRIAESTKLLCALRPYLSDKRGQMIDQILKLEQLAEIIKLTR